MKKITPFVLLLSLFLTSCSSNESSLNENKSLLKSFRIIKNAQGHYSIDYDVNKNVTSEIVKDINSNSNDIYLFAGKGTKEESFSEVLLLQNDFLKVGFVENNEKRKSIIIEDKDIVLAKGIEGTSEYLEEYSIEDLGNSEYELKFKVKDGISTSFLYNDTEDIYEVHLQQGEAEQKSFSRKYVKTSNALKIDFVNYLTSEVAAKGMRASVSRPRRPRAIIQE